MGKKFIVNVFDRRYFGQYDRKTGEFRPQPIPANKDLISPLERGYENITIHVNELSSPSDVAKRIRFELDARQGNDGDVLRLRFIGHGRAGYLGIGTGLRASNFASFEDLKGILDPNVGRVEMHGCWNASAGSSGIHCPTPGTLIPSKTNPIDYGYNMLHAASRAFQAPVIGGLNCQYRDEVHTFEGPTRSVFWMNRFYGPNVPNAARDFFKKKKITLPDISFPKPFQPPINTFALKHKQLFREPFSYRNDWIRQGKINLPNVSLKNNFGSSYVRRSPFDSMPSFGTSLTGEYSKAAGDWARNLIRSGGIKLSDVLLRNSTQPRPPSYGLPPMFVSHLEPPHWAGDLMKKGGIKLPDVSLRPTPPF